MDEYSLIKVLLWRFFRAGIASACAVVAVQTVDGDPVTLLKAVAVGFVAGVVNALGKWARATSEHEEYTLIDKLPI